VWQINIDMVHYDHNGIPGQLDNMEQHVQQCPNDWHLSQKPQAILDHAVSLCAVEPLQQGGRSLSIH
jgi:hypothetical protein